MIGWRRPGRAKREHLEAHAPELLRLEQLVAGVGPRVPQIVVPPRSGVIADDETPPLNDEDEKGRR